MKVYMCNICLWLKQNNIRFESTMLFIVALQR